MAELARSKSRIADMLRTAILLSVLSLVAVSGWAVSDATPPSNAKSESAEPRPRDLAASLSHDLQAARPESLHRGLNGKSEGGKGNEGHSLLKGPPFSGANMRKTQHQPGTLKGAVGQTAHQQNENRVQPTGELHEARWPGSGNPPRTVAPLMGVGSHPASPTAALNHSLPMQALIPRSPASTGIGGPAGANARTTAALNGTRIQRKP